MRKHWKEVVIYFSGMALLMLATTIAIYNNCSTDKIALIIGFSYIGTRLLCWSEKISKDNAG